MQNFKLIIYTLPVIKRRCHEEWCHEGSLRFSYHFILYFTPISCLYQKKAVTLHDFSEAASLLFTNN